MQNHYIVDLDSHRNSSAIQCGCIIAFAEVLAAASDRSVENLLTERRITVSSVIITG